MQKTLDTKLAAIRANPNSREFILADAKDADMAFGIGAAGQSPESYPGEVRFRTLKEYRDTIREIVRQELVDIMLMSASTNEALTIHERIFERSPVTPAARANDTTDIHVVRGGRYIHDPSQPFRSASIDHIQCGHLDCGPDERTIGADLGLYSVTFTNTTADDLRTLEAFREFRLEAEQKNFRYFLEVFDPNVADHVPADRTGAYVNDMIARCLGGVVGKGRPAFLKMVYHGPQAMEELFRYDPSLVIGILGGSAGTTYDAFKLLAEAQKYGARVALYGRKINNAENQFAFIRFLRLIADGVVSPEEAVRAYHGVLQKLGVKPQRSLEEDQQLQTGVMSYGGTGKTISVPTPKVAATGESHAACPCSATKRPAAEGAKSGGCTCHHESKTQNSTNVSPAIPTVSVVPEKPNIGKMTSAQRLEYFREQIARVTGDSGRITQRVTQSSSGKYSKGVGK